ncbi:hypothetical protein Tsubulata_049326 [Turnera subulata]|uniref:BED-type domain-containing protein n=1 Tax=Turnera subulata TaxID=218843 RepID=A0A9Q0FGU5_9ROSI|nr:hypothetical protein Tsubulata_049326 [Turnera subulata]
MSTTTGINDATSQTVASNTVEIEDERTNDNQISPNKKGLKSSIWDHYKRQKIDDKWKAICKYCSRKLVGETRMGTKHLHDHISICKLRTVRGPRQMLLSTMPVGSSSTGTEGDSVVVGNYTFNQRFRIVNWDRGSFSF